MGSPAPALAPSATPRFAMGIAEGGGAGRRAGVWADGLFPGQTTTGSEALLGVACIFPHHRCIVDRSWGGAILYTLGASHAVTKNQFYQFK
jgi:hypothetical protein